METQCHLRPCHTSSNEAEENQDSIALREYPNSKAEQASEKGAATSHIETPKGIAKEPYKWPSKTYSSRSVLIRLSKAESETHLAQDLV